MDSHEATVRKIRSRVEHYHQAKIAFRVYHGSTNSTRHAGFDQDAIVDVSSLNNVLSIDYKKKTALVEPNVPMDALVRETMKVGLLPPVVMEFPGITVGGGFVGTAGESSSFKYGFFDRTVLHAEVVLADGTLVTASNSENQELFEGLRGSFGTLGVLTMVEMQLVPLKKFVEVTYHPTFSFENATSTMQYHTSDLRNDYVDGVLFSKGAGVIVTGRLADTTDGSDIPIQRFSRPWDEWFWIHARSLGAKGIITKEFVPIEDYLFRYDRGAFWMGMYAYKQYVTSMYELHLRHVLTSYTNVKVHDSVHVVNTFLARLLYAYEDYVPCSSYIGVHGSVHHPRHSISKWQRSTFLGVC